MGKSAHKSRKRRHPSPSDRLSGIERKLSRLIHVLSRNEVGRSSPFRASSQKVYDPRDVSSPDDFIKGASARSKSPSDRSAEAVPASQERPNPRDVGAANLPGRYLENIGGRTSQPFSSILNNLSPISAQADGQVSENERSLTPLPTESVELASELVPAASEFIETNVDVLTNELFGSELEKTEKPLWNDLVSQTWLNLTRAGLAMEQRDSLLAKYSPSEDLSFLKAPKLNPEFRSGLKSNSIIKRDEFNTKDQDQPACVALCAFGKAISDFLNPEIQQSLNSEARSAVSKVNDGAKILADLFYRLSLSRRAQIKPALNLLAKNTAEAIPADNLLFGTSFGEMKKATTMEKSSRDIVRSL